MKKTAIIISVILVLVLILGISAFFYISTFKTAPTKTTSTSSDGSTSMSATFYDENGNPISIGTAQALLGGNSPAVRFVSFLIKVKYTTGNADLSGLKIGSTTTPMSENIGTKIPLLTTLAKTQTTYVTFLDTTKSNAGGTCSLSTECGAKENCVGSLCLINLTKYESANVGVANLINYSLTIKYNITDALGNQVTQESSWLSLVYDLRGEACLDGTKYLSCASTKPQYCSNTTATGPVSLINKASVCGCPSGQHASGEVCVTDTCSDPASTLYHTCATSPLTSLISNPNANKRYCATTGSALIEDCRGPDGTAGNGDDCGCATDYNSGTGTCQSTGLCSYPTYTGGLSGCIPDCLGKTTGANDGCGGTC